MIYTQIMHKITRLFIIISLPPSVQFYKMRTDHEKIILSVLKYLQ